jgi:hypothetical protein
VSLCRKLAASRAPLFFSPTDVYTTYSLPFRTSPPRQVLRIISTSFDQARQACGILYNTRALSSVEADAKQWSYIQTASAPSRTGN